MSTPALSGVHHVKIPVTDIERSRHWYESTLGLRVQRDFRDDDGVVRGLAGTLSSPEGEPFLSIALRQNPQVAQGIHGFDPLSLYVPNQGELEAWKDHLERLGHGVPDATPNGNVLLLHDPDGIEIRIFGTRP
ncbi:VOC family protein [Rothia sp. HC945]|jgi:catechol 2,3-dioxygenase-like lactoylglutathione lyase family enzyme|uniref:VOC family protein n=1 Tax=Rothia sp. HC945 TaxID=3171170 RepID=UPI0026543F7E|nr:VOC family protein [Kocuria sp.]MDN5618520.1 VOC family protein [Kocuria sp.]MDN5654677.1 VOC family protein [Kocuria sp.]